MEKLKPTYKSHTVQHFVNLYENGQLNLSPAFQRDSVWSKNDRRKLIESILKSYPVPSIFLYKRIDERGRHVYDVLDGKQRLETIFMFQGLRGFTRNKFMARVEIDSEHIEEWGWRKLQQSGHEHRLMSYEFQTVEIEGELSEIRELFVRINSTGKKLTSAEVRQARYFNSEVLKEAKLLTRKHKNFLLSLLSPSQINRMKDIELVSELLCSVYSGGLLDKKRAIDKIIGGEKIDRRLLLKHSKQCTKTMNLLKRMFPEIHTTICRAHQEVDQQPE